jgi:hypothetical protein
MPALVHPCKSQKNTDKGGSRKLLNIQTIDSSFKKKMYSPTWFVAN